MTRLKTLVVAALALGACFAPHATAQSASALKRELRQMEKDAGKDVTALLEVAEWAKEKGLVADRRRILNDIIKQDPDNGPAHEALGFVKYEGEWMTKSKAEGLREKALAAEMKAKGLIEVDGVWVTKDEEADAKKGIFMHDGERVSKSDKLALVQGMIRHPATGTFIAPEDESKADEGLFPLGNDKWGSKEEADEYHSDSGHPWVVRTYNGWIVSNRSFDEIESMKSDIDAGIESAARVFGGEMPSPANRPVVLVAASDEQYRELGNAVGAEGSAYAVFHAEGEVVTTELGAVRPVISNWQKEGWGPYWMRHAGGLAYAYAIAAEIGAEPPLWFQRGLAGYAERHYAPGQAAWFGKQHLEKGGVKDIGNWFDRFEISGNLESRMLDFNMYQAGLVLDFGMNGGHADCTEKMLAVTKAIQEGDGSAADKAIAKFQKAVTDNEDALREYFRKVLQKG